MDVLGKDLFDRGRPHTNTKVEFGASGYWVEPLVKPLPYGTILTEILNLDVTPFQDLLDRLNQTIQERDFENAPRAYMDMNKGFGMLPLYRLYLADFRFFGNMTMEKFVVGESREAFAEFLINQDDTLPCFMQEQLDSIRFIQQHYAWFLDGIFEGKAFEKKKKTRGRNLWHSKFIQGDTRRLSAALALVQIPRWTFQTSKRSIVSEESGTRPR